MRIALYAGMFRRDQDGATKTLYRLVDGLVKEGHTLAVWAFSHDPIPIQGVRFFTVPSIPLPLYKEYRIARLARRNRNELEEFAPDIVHISVPDLVGLSMQNWAFDHGIPSISTFHTDFPSYLRSYGLNIFYAPLWNYFSWFYRRFRRVLAPTEVVRELLRSHGIENTALLKRGIDLTQFSPIYRSEALRKEWGLEPGQAVILFVGRLVWYKGLEEFCRVYECFHEMGGLVPRFVLAGCGPIETELKARMPQADFRGQLTGMDLAQTYASADLLLFPSGTETYGNVIMEALASGIPVVVSDQGGCREIVTQSQAGLIARFADSDAFFTACRSLLTEPARYDACRRNGIRYTRDQSWASIVLQLNTHYQDILTSGKRKSLQPSFSALHVEPRSSRIS